MANRKEITIKLDCEEVNQTIERLKERVEQLGKMMADLEEKIQSQQEVKYALDGREIAKTVKKSVKGSYS